MSALHTAPWCLAFPGECNLPAATLADWYGNFAQLLRKKHQPPYLPTYIQRLQENDWTESEIVVPASDLVRLVEAEGRDRIAAMCEAIARDLWERANEGRVPVDCAGDPAIARWEQRMEVTA